MMRPSSTHLKRTTRDRGLVRSSLPSLILTDHIHHKLHGFRWRGEGFQFGQLALLDVFQCLSSRFQHRFSFGSIYKNCSAHGSREKADSRTVRSHTPLALSPRRLSSFRSFDVRRRRRTRHAELCQGVSDHLKRTPFPWPLYRLQP